MKKRKQYKLHETLTFVNGSTKLNYVVSGNHLKCIDQFHENQVIFIKAGLLSRKIEFCNRAYGYKSNDGLFFPTCKSGDIEALNRVIDAFREHYTILEDLEYADKLFKVDLPFIKQAHASACSEWKTIIENKFPEAFIKTELEKGNWYKCNSEIFNVVKCVEDGCDEGFGIWKKQSNGKLRFDVFFIADSYEIATREEIELALVEYAKQQGYRKGNYIDLKDKNIGRDISGWHYCSKTDRLYTANIDEGGDIVYEDGQWAQILETITKKEALDRFNVIVK